MILMWTRPTLPNRLVQRLQEALAIMQRAVIQATADRLLDKARRLKRMQVKRLERTPVKRLERMQAKRLERMQARRLERMQAKRLERTPASSRLGPLYPH